MSEYLSFDLVAHLKRQRDWSERTFGPGDRMLGIADHIRKEFMEIDEEMHNGSNGSALLGEWVDVILLALDGAWRAGFEPERIAGAIAAKQRINEERRWPDWRTAALGHAIEHDRSGG